MLEREVTDLAPTEVDGKEEIKDNSGEPKRKRQRLEENKCTEPVFNIGMLAVNGLMEMLQRVNSQMELREKISEQAGRAVSEMSKVVSDLHSLRKAVEESARNAKGREVWRGEAERLLGEEQEIEKGGQEEGRP